MKNRNDIESLKQLLVEHSEPNEKNIKDKIEFNIDNNRQTAFTDILVKARVKNILIILISILLVAAVALSIVFTVDLASPNIIEDIDNPVKENPMHFFDGSKALWGDSIDVTEYNCTNGTRIMKFYNYNETLSVKSSNIDDFFQFFYEGVKDTTLIKINMFVHLENKLANRFENYTLFPNSLKWNNIEVKYYNLHLKSENIFNVFFHDEANNYNYTIDITCYGNSEATSQTLKNILSDLRVA